MKNFFVISFVIIMLGLSFWAGTFYVQIQRSEELRCKEFGPSYPYSGGETSCVKSGCKAVGMGEWSCVPKLPILF